MKSGLWGWVLRKGRTRGGEAWDGGSEGLSWAAQGPG